MDRFGDKVCCNPAVKLKKQKSYPIIDIDKITPGYKTVRSVESVEYTGQGGAKFQDHDVLFARITPCLENGKMAIADTEGQNGIGSTELFVFRGIDGVSDTDYVYYLLCMKHIRQLAANSMTGASGRQRADLDFIKRIQWNFPDIETQKKISSVLSAYDNLIEVNNKRIKTLEQMAENLYKEWFVRFRFPGHETAEFENGIPKGWGYFKSDWWIEEGIPAIKIKDIVENTVDLTDLSRVSQEHADNAKQFYVSAGDLLIALTGATIGKIALVPFAEKMTVNQRVGKFFIPTPAWESVAFLYCFFLQNNVQEEIASIAGSNAAQPNISPIDIENLKTYYQEDVVKQFNDTLSPLILYMLTLRKANDNLIHQRDFLLPRLMIGKLEV